MSMSMKQGQPLPDERKIRVVIVCPGGRYFEGGISRAVGYLVDAWRDQDDAPEARIVDPRGPGSLLWSPFYLARAAAQIAWIFATGKADILHVNVSVRASTVRKSIVAFVASVLRIPYVVHVHSGLYHQFFSGLRGPFRAFTRRMFTRARRVIVLGNQWRDFARDGIGVEARHIVVMHNAVPGPESIDRDSDPEGRCHILFLGRLSPAKGVPELVEALGKPDIASLPWTAVLAGDGDTEPYRTAAARLSIADRMEFPGWVGPETVKELLASADVLVLPSHHEGLPMSILEGMAYRLALITTPVGAIPEAVEDGVSGLLVPPRDVDALADALGRVIADPDLRRQLSDGARQAFLERFDVRGYATRMTRLYEEVLSRRP